MPRIELTADDVFELKRLRDLAQKQSRDAKWIDDKTLAGGFANTDTQREAQHALETLERILKQT